MMEKLVATGAHKASTVTRAIDAPATRRAAGLPLSLYVMQLILAYVWLLSGLEKLANPDFGAQLPAMLRGNTVVNLDGWYSAFLKQLVLPHVSLLAPLIEVGELATGVALIVSAVLWMWRPLAALTRYTGWAACLALAGSALLSLNYAFQQGTPLPWADVAQFFSSSTGMGILIALLSVPVLTANVRAIGMTSARRCRRRIRDAG